MSIEVVNESGFDGVNEEALIDVATFVLGEMDVHPDAEATISVVDVATMSDLHVRWMDLEGPTDVMSFPMDELTPGMGRPDAQPFGPAMLGDIILCPEFAAKQAAKAGHDMGHELALLTTHGCLHLLGYDHIEPEDEQEMFALQNELLQDWYTYCARRGVEFQPKPSNAGAFPSAADRAELDKLVPGGGIPAIGEPQ
ncbi:rRNA maturation RNase YbeY [Corynebacterium diphtheriae bv. mitis]|uniref:Endoribonuclease YbeY n=2 Tax=Corynebacterium diphtheriae TaxID=1717 RepID=YBEY_CORDI|nr:rRNA maturation RNase YbeY [Corynebacterium diphtheriae]Q6NG17.1 RecName: Full=Endoribonuclease YbeY [Corynebacterium diphtheriae NCTC 13129]AEX44706.1 putative metalloprotease [Corynebacterium diphtheriae 241]AEX46903.1 putative metalloprotease [Corynebacterium diphtheriae INCA 402]AEX49208.1 putative metalloprotease [Corynebacterium diphtheriae BH8]AEX72601.1 putative metalloprotease [Corynebacterium diphtheriae CDCE 8392]AEX74896.1 putative metalloprotease [Corynebacterium diphtheriae H